MKTHDMEALSQHITEWLLDSCVRRQEREGAAFVRRSIGDWASDTIESVRWYGNSIFSRVLLPVSQTELATRLLAAQNGVLATGQPCGFVVCSQPDVPYYHEGARARRERRGKRFDTYLEYIMCAMSVCPADGTIGAWICSGYVPFRNAVDGAESAQALTKWFSGEFTRQTKDFRENREKLVTEWDHYCSTGEK